MIRSDGRSPAELRPTSISLGVQEFAEGSALVETGRTRVVCAVSVEDRVPQFLRGRGTGWITAEYAMLPRATSTRTSRESKFGGRSREIQRLIGRSLRAVVDMDQIGERTLIVDCDVLQADGGTRTAAITGAYVALYQAFQTLVERKTIPLVPFNSTVAATSVGILNDEILLDLCYEEDFQAQSDFNVVMTDEGEFVEVQGTAEGQTFSKIRLDQVLSLAETGINSLFKVQQNAIDSL